MDDERSTKQQEKEQRMGHRRTQLANRSLELQKLNQQIDAQLDLTDAALNKPSKNMDTYQKLFNHNTEFFSTYNPDMIEEAFVKCLRKEKIEPKVNKNKYKITFTKLGKDEMVTDEEIEDNVEICMRLLHAESEQKVCIEFTRLNGRKTTFFKLFENYKNDILKFANDTMLDAK